MHTSGSVQPRREPRLPATRRALLSWGGASLAAVVGAACAGPAQQTPGAAGTTLPEVIVRVHARTGSEDEAYQKRLNDFAEQNGKNVKAVYEGLGDYYNKLVTLIVAGTVGDI